MTKNQGRTVLVVDDCDDTRSLIGAMLRQAGYQVREALSGADAARAVAERPDLVIRCVNDGPAVAAGPVLELSAGDRGSREGVDARLTLPATPGQLATTVGPTHAAPGRAGAGSPAAGAAPNSANTLRTAR